MPGSILTAFVTGPSLTYIRKRIMVFALLLSFNAAVVFLVIQKPSIEDRFLSAFMRRYYSSAAQMFHVPRDSSEADIVNDRKSIIAMMTAIHSSLGRIKDVRQAKKITGDYMTFELSPGNVAYWQSFDRITRKKLYAVHFNSGEQGALGIESCKGINEWEIIKLSLSIETNEKNEAVIRYIIHEVCKDEEGCDAVIERFFELHNAQSRKQAQQ